MTLPDWEDKTTAELEAERDELNATLARRYAAETAPQRAAAEQERHEMELDRIARDWHSEHGGTGTPDSPREWAPPEGLHDLWPQGSITERVHKVWSNTRRANPEPPDVPESGWVRGVADVPTSPEEDA